MLLPLSTDFLIVIHHVTANESEISSRDQTDVDDRTLREVVLEVLNQDLRMIIVIITSIEGFVNPANLTVTKMSPAHTLRRQTLLARICGTHGPERSRSTFTISQVDDVTLLNFASTLEGRDDGMESNDCLIQWSARQADPTRNHKLRPDTVLECPGETEPVQHSLLKFFSLHATREQVHHTKVLDVQLTNLVRSILLRSNPFVSECVNFKRNTCFAAEGHNVDDLLHGVIDNITHRTRPVNVEDETVVLTVRERSYLLENIVVVLISVKLRCVEYTSARLSSTSIRSSTLLHLKLFDEIVYLTQRRLLEFFELLIYDLKVTHEAMLFVFLVVPAAIDIVESFVAINNHVAVVYTRALAVFWGRGGRASKILDCVC